MSMGFIIFLITIAFSLFSAMGDKQHEKRQKQQPPRPKKHVESPDKGFFDKVQETLAEIEDTFSAEEISKREASEEKHTSNKHTTKPVSRPEVVRTESKTSTTSSRRNDIEQERQHLNDMVADRMNQLDDELHRERQKQLARIERRAKMIIEDQYLSNRTKQIKLKALMDTTNVKNTSAQGMTFSDNEVINGIIWSEILNKPKQL
ncbi:MULTISPECIES: hypothetical protein [unclassified Staphylococcus]|uniref:hypothetical protein n=1 Tax=unclassified Staphylococcus TaxID=91994 RepID=UPI0021D17BC9|nr:MULTISPECIES: hypothetical protein [unclassified Staphylococcus]UXR77333.1 hypothetical protein MUA92_05505 [Staphylococcus sp. IVB6227]UXR81596.1 hypothetical protein MUA51_05745 [Staphylococcus sp. IVB6214]